jgi:hypothetical protein
MEVVLAVIHQTMESIVVERLQAVLLSDSSDFEGPLVLVSMCSLHPISPGGPPFALKKWVDFATKCNVVFYFRKKESTTTGGKKRPPSEGGKLRSHKVGEPYIHFTNTVTDLFP